MSTHLAPTLRLVPTASVRFHEHPEHRRTEKLLRRLTEDRMLRNPPIVAELDGGQHLLLDGANRMSAFVELGLSHVPVQVVDYGDDDIQLRRWQHLLLEGRALDLRAAYAKMPEIRFEQVPSHEIFRRLEAREVFAALVDESHTCWGVFPSNAEDRYDLRRMLDVLEDVVAAYEGRTQLERIKLADPSDIPEAIADLDHQVVLFPIFSKSELVQLVTQGLLIPTGITRHVIPGRALGLNVDLGFLTTMETDEEKLAHFRSYLDKIQLEGRIRFYQESVFILNE
ncbi:MAG: hypothetical protein KC729_00965 [Candidatus Eisenbacteria bacterium]|uniref:ParB/Sulfiredoxin domain-containing protein n=1 Tax=Eiseniibacteriota bacterium TaxID=2212470 RepID=A0A956RMN2_UNCEI|nr:hypothetical protein [Candidatus Eisenbacteria bacterium]